MLTLEAQEEKFNGLQRLTLLEKAYSKQRKTEIDRFVIIDKRNSGKYEVLQKQLD